MPNIVDPATTLSDAFVALFNGDAAISAYNWQKWESDVDVQQPRGYINCRYQADLHQAEIMGRFDLEAVFEGKPKRGTTANAVAEVVGQVRRGDLVPALMAIISDGSITLFHTVEDLRIEQRIQGDVRVRTVSFSMFGQWNVGFT
jgi:hypothetical protein